MANVDFMFGRSTRTFAPAIPLLPEPVRHEVTVACLLLRIIDTLEVTYPRAHRISALTAFIALLHSPLEQQAVVLERCWKNAPSSSHTAYRELSEELPRLIVALLDLAPSSRATIVAHVSRTGEGMREILERSGDGGDFLLGDLRELRRYCCVVAGIVGEMLTELFLPHIPAAPDVAPKLRRHAIALGEGLLLVDILRNAHAHAGEGPVYCPPGISSGTILPLARVDLVQAMEYIDALREAGAPKGIIGFCALPVRLAFAALERLDTLGMGAELSRAEVAHILNDVNAALDRVRSPSRLHRLVAMAFIAPSNVDAYVHHGDRPASQVAYARGEVFA